MSTIKAQPVVAKEGEDDDVICLDDDGNIPMPVPMVMIKKEVPNQIQAQGQIVNFQVNQGVLENPRAQQEEPRTPRIQNHDPFLYGNRRPRSFFGPYTPNPKPKHIFSVNLEDFEDEDTVPPLVPWVQQQRTVKQEIREFPEEPEPALEPEREEEPIPIPTSFVPRVPIVRVKQEAREDVQDQIQESQQDQKIPNQPEPEEEEREADGIPMIQGVKEEELDLEGGFEDEPEEEEEEEEEEEKFEEEFIAPNQIPAQIQTPYHLPVTTNVFGNPEMLEEAEKLRKAEEQILLLEMRAKTKRAEKQVKDMEAASKEAALKERLEDLENDARIKKLEEQVRQKMEEVTGVSSSSSAVLSSPEPQQHAPAQLPVVQSPQSAPRLRRDSFNQDFPPVDDFSLDLSHLAGGSSTQAVRSPSPAPLPKVRRGRPSRARAPVDDSSLDLSHLAGSSSTSEVTNSSPAPLPPLPRVKKGRPSRAQLALRQASQTFESSNSTPRFPGRRSQSPSSEPPAKKTRFGRISAPAQKSPEPVLPKKRIQRRPKKPSPEPEPDLEPAYLFFNGHFFRLDNKIQNYHYWKCKFHARRDCRARMTTSQDHKTIVHEPTTQHSHPEIPDFVKWECGIPEAPVHGKMYFAPYERAKQPFRKYMLTIPKIVKKD